MPKLLHKDKDVTVELDELSRIVKKTVYRLNHSGLKSKVAPNEMVQREIRALEMVRDVPHIQRFSMLSDTPDSLYSEYVPGKHLTQYQGRLPKQFFDDVEQALKACRKKGVYRLDRFLHADRDIIVRPDLSPGILDFGDVLFLDDPRAKIPGITKILEVYSFIQMKHLRLKYNA